MLPLLSHIVCASTYTLPVDTEQLVALKYHECLKAKTIGERKKKKKKLVMDFLRKPSKLDWAVLCRSPTGDEAISEF